MSPESAGCQAERVTIPFRFGVVSMQPPRGSRWIDHVRRVEELGYDTVVMPDNLGNGLAVFPALAAAAAATSRLRLGSYVLANDIRHPVQVAKEALAVALLSGGRLELGLGAGRAGSEADNAMLGLGFDSPGVRVSRLAESVSIIKRLLAGETVDHESPYYSVAGASIVGWGVEPQAVPILIAGGQRRMITLAGAEADILALGMSPETPADEVAERIGWLRAAAAGRPVEVNLNLMAVGDAVPRYLDGRLDTARLAAAGAVGVATGSPAEIADRLREQRDRLGISYIVVADELMDVFTPVVQRLAGE
ncbi:MAG: TIGR03621 family F420-dependent LLM class oxidoreductase [Microlunatus sp.]|nr:TIGR03621 family F420-dependent LLM class oxidoreductase [Microlunatus sp.]